MQKSIIISLILSFIVINGYGQESSVYSKSNAILFNIDYYLHQPNKDLADRFGRNLSIGGGVEFINKHHYIFGIDGYYLFGQIVKEDPLAQLRTYDGGIIGANDAFTSLVLRERGYFIGATLGKIFQFNPKSSSRSGIRVAITGGMLQHKIRIQDDYKNAPQVAGNYVKGYDRLTNGPALRGFIGYQYLSSNKLINLKIGFDYTIGFTKSKRAYDYDLMSADTKQRTDILYGLRIGWILPFYLVKEAGDIYY
ncbi:MAG: hypothetical protein KBA06_03010 [Saprospiraceae bacterium]|nr:hypothetical protein [Saprospiraceae bacterium]